MCGESVMAKVRWAVAICLPHEMKCNLRRLIGGWGSAEMGLLKEGGALGSPV